jgi:TolA-binding protein
MEDKKITPEELKAAWSQDVDDLAAKVAAAMNSAQPGNIIDDSEEPVRDANAEFRQRLYQKAVNLLQDKQLQEDFSPSQDSPRTGLEE